MSSEHPHNGPESGPDATLEAVRQLSEYRLKLDQLLDRVERSTTHYDALGLNEAATYEGVVRAYYKTISTLYPAYQIRASIPEETLDRMDRTFSKVSWAFSTLADFKKRADYHLLVLAKTKGVAAHPSPPPSASKKRDADGTLQALKEARRATGSRPGYVGTDPARQGPEHEVRMPAMARGAYKEHYSKSKDDNRRRSQRFELTLPSLLTGYDRAGVKWSEMTQSIDVSRRGVTLRLRRHVRCGLVVYLTIPLPANLRPHGFSNASFSSYALVRRVEPPKKGERVVALEFIGEHPPAGYLEKPWTVFKANQWTGKERRRVVRQNRVEKVRVEYFNDAFLPLGQEDAVTENISSQGMRIRAAKAPFEFDLLRLTCPALNLECLAVVRNRYVNKDNIERLCVQFVNRRIERPSQEKRGA